MRQACGLVPIVKSEVLIDGGHSIARSGAVANRVLYSCMIALWLCTLNGAPQARHH